MSKIAPHSSHSEPASAVEPQVDTLRPKSRGLSIAGRKRYTKPDFYETPRNATKALLEVEKFTGNILEPACGLGAISEVLKTEYEVISYDIEPLEYGQQEDFFLETGHYDNIVTNPPYNKGLEFVNHAKKVARYKIAMIMKLTFLESERRRHLFSDKDFPLAHVYVFRKRVQMYPYGIEKPVNQGTIAYAWFVWDKEHKGKAQIDWI